MRRLRFLSRDGQVLYELARRLAGTYSGPHDLEYVYSSRLTWSLAATDPSGLADSRWLFNSFMHSSAADLCARLGIAAGDFTPQFSAAGVSLDPDCHADQPDQHLAMQRFLRMPEVTRAARRRIAEMRSLVADYARQHQLADPDTALVDAGWTGRMIGAFSSRRGGHRNEPPHVLLWGHEPRVTGWTDPDRVAPWMYNTATGQGASLRVPDAPFLVETFCAGDHGVVTGYQRQQDGRIAPILAAEHNQPALDWGLQLYRTVLYTACDALTPPSDDDIRPLVHDVMDAFWCTPTVAEADAWGGFPYDSDPASTAAAYWPARSTSQHQLR